MITNLRKELFEPVDDNVLKYTESVTVTVFLFQKHEVNPIAAQKARSNNWDPKASSVLAAIQAQ